ncbi:MAG: hypothetical protein KDI09_00010 [Halioglobus sp.]|nr:hypothetical protein [Halioglobus sp.]
MLSRSLRQGILAAAISTIAVIFTGATASAGIIYDESVSGDLSGSFTAPTFISLGVGANTVVGQMGPNGNTGAIGGNDADYFRFTLGSGETLDSISVDAYTFAPTDPGVSFFGYVMNVVFAGQGIADIDGFVLFNGASGDILDDIAGGSLGAGDYAFWIQETSANTVNYQLTFNTSRASDVPAPAVPLLLGIGLLCLQVSRFRVNHD